MDVARAVERAEQNLEVSPVMAFAKQSVEQPSAARSAFANQGFENALHRALLCRCRCTVVGDQGGAGRTTVAMPAGVSRVGLVPKVTDESQHPAAAAVGKPCDFVQLRSAMC